MPVILRYLQMNTKWNCRICWSAAPAFADSQHLIWKKKRHLFKYQCST